MHAIDKLAHFSRINKRVSRGGETKDGVLVFRRVHVAPQLVGGEPKLRFEAEGRRVIAVIVSGASGHREPVFYPTKNGKGRMKRASFSLE